MKNKSISLARITQQIKGLQKEKLTNLLAAPLQDDMFTWHFTIQGPQDTDFHEGLYHGQIYLPFQYPFKPPDIVFKNNNGRFQTNKKICLTITQYHPEQWNSAWTIRTMLQAVISLFNQNIQGVGYIQASSQARKFLAKQSHNYSCPKCGMIKDLLKPRGARIQKQINKVQSGKQTKKLLLGNEKIQWTAEQIQRSNKILQSEKNKFNAIDSVERQRRNRQLDQYFLKQEHQNRMNKMNRKNQMQRNSREKREAKNKLQHKNRSQSSIKQQRLYQYNKSLFEEIQTAKNQYQEAVASIRWLDD